MKAVKWIIIISFLFQYLNCTDKLTNTPNDNIQGETGKMALNIDKTTVPVGVTEVTATLTREGYNPVSGNLNLVSDSTGDLLLENIPAGTWHLTVNASDVNGTILYSGETDVSVENGQTVQVNLTLEPTGSGYGSIYIYVNWGIPQTDWIDYSGNPVFSPSENPSNTSFCGESKIIYENGIYKMWYLCTYDAGRANIWYAESPDGINWQNKTTTPVLNTGAAGSWDGNAVSPAAVIKDGNYYKLYYNGVTQSFGRSYIGLATSTDGINWEKSTSPVFTGDSINEYYLITEAVLKVNNTYYLYYTSAPEYDYYKTVINLATSTDGINWTKYAGNPVMAPGFSWEGTGVFYPSVIYDQNKFLMVYENSSRSKFGTAVSEDGKNWTKKSETPAFSNYTTLKKYIQIDYPCLIKTGSGYSVYNSASPGKYSLQISCAEIPSLN